MGTRWSVIPWDPVCVDCWMGEGGGKALYCRGGLAPTVGSKELEISALLSGDWL